MHSTMDILADSAIVYHQGNDYGVMYLDITACANTVDGGWTRSILDTAKYQANGWPLDYRLFRFPFHAEAKYIDQCAKGLSILGSPFFYGRNLEQYHWGLADKPAAQSVLIQGREINMINTKRFGQSREWLVTEHMQFLVNWLFRDETNAALKRFHVVPLEVSVALGELFQGSENLVGVGGVLHRYSLLVRSGTITY
jgi:hypothetical protein